MFSREIDKLSGIEAALNPQMLQQWLGAERWALVGENPGLAQMWLSPPDMGTQRQVLLPLDKSYVDYPRRMKSVIDGLSRLYSMSFDDLAESIANASADLFFVRLQQSSIDGTIPLKQAADVLDSINRMVRAAATSTVNPFHSHAGRRPAVVNDFMEDDLRFGHTKRGSFIMTVAARIDLDDCVEGPAEELYAPFSRRVMSTLASGLGATREIANDQGEMVGDLDEVRALGVSLPLVQSICEITEAEGLREVDFSFEWAPVGLKVPTVNDKVVFEHADAPAVSAFRDKLREKQEPERETLMGRVTDLRRETLPGSQVEERTILLEAEYQDRLRKFRVDLSEDAYEWAIYAHRERLPFTVSGIPQRKGRWTLADAVVDTEFLRAQRRSTR